MGDNVDYSGELIRQQSYRSGFRRGVATGFVFAAILGLVGTGIRACYDSTVPRGVQVITYPTAQPTSQPTTRASEGKLPKLVEGGK